jgi:ribosomal 50S subunit-associated protein YjgA (DUF615 family)
MHNENTLRNLRESLDRFEHLVRTQATYIAELERERDILVADLKAMMARCPDPNDSVIDLVED